MLLPSILKQLITILFILSAILSSISHCRSSSSSEEEEGSYIDCGRTYECGDLKNISYPLWGADFRPLSCGREGFEVECRNNKQPVIRINGQEFRILNISKTGNGVKIARNDLLESDGLCNENTVAITLNYSLFDYASTVRNLTLIYSCQQGSTLVGSLKNFTCDANGQTVYYTTEERYLSKPEAPIIQRNCNLVQVPVLRASIDENPDPIGRKEVEQVVRQGFEVDYSQQLTFMCNQCERSGGRCGSNATDGFLCYCRNNKSHDMVCHPEDRTNWKIGVVLGAICAAIGILLTCVIICVTRNVKLPRKFFSQMTKSDKDIEGFIRSYGHLHVKRYRFSDIKQMTISFKEKLGRGGYGDVYKGKLLDGRLVAVKLLNESKGNGEEFINEVASISRTSHINVVTLVGFCLEGNKRALVYEFMSNGSLEKFIYNENPLQTTPQLEWKKLLQIAKGIAEGLQYLHHGCNTRILHFDIKPHNILLNKDFCPKISDFGLAKLCERKESIISMADARGTIGYIAPEVFNRNFGGVSHKSDVYSYGMMILEMVGGRKNIKVGVSNTSEIYFPHWIYKNLEQGTVLGLLHGVVTAEEDEIARKMVLVGLWCIQTNPLDRPSMKKVIEMLEGSLEALHIPPKPFLSPSKSPEEFSDATSIL
ncbi:LEAF RUST 10 DISEASE-RESISTANCE LOCUS RECEPTOR-LIKE PROTEIN KINASE-like 2.4 isoform X2 [Ziziphus jujuba]|uniref:non-specific serine/threonine protein kinase n=1 Tax=Ziziphus jujuba TaxID=326968 RepID=A0ABM3IIC3_ZIZJJ|nr:LEAF RUST 10 DISEASE-RESISTANCE LOCUS RECEPTOR-LIKE PROTEIN KINASE-like 2.4 isoform X2 [Ziziphus jujuba]